MIIGYDAKRAFHNGTGLGHYSRTLLQSLSTYYPDNTYYLFNPKTPSSFHINGSNLKEVNPSSFFSRLFSSAWRSSGVKNECRKLGVQLYHGLSHEIPLGIQNTNTRSVVTMHDLIHERYPKQYAAVDVKIYRKKFTNACIHANRIIAISEQTKKDLVEFYKVPAEKIDVCYQSCNPAFSLPINEEQKKLVKEKYALPQHFFLSVGSIIERKNLLNVCRAMKILGKDAIPLVVIGEGGKYYEKVKAYVTEQGLDQQVIFLSYTDAAKDPLFRNAYDFPAIYQLATAMIYPSFFEGFGIPVLEALSAGLPVITSNVSCLPEAGGDAAYYIDPSSPEEIAAAMKAITSDSQLVQSMKEKGKKYAERFTTEKTAKAVMDVYVKTMSA